jgi:hypothetical protein
VRRSPMNVIGAILVLVTLVGVCNALTMGSARAATVFSNYTGSNCKCGFDGAFFAEEFSPASDFDFTGAAAFVGNSDVLEQSFSIALYAFIPGSPLWTSGTLTASKGAALASASYSGSPILLKTGTEYFLVLNLSSSSSLGWLGQGSSSAPAFTSTDGSSWSDLAEQNLQFEIFGVAPPGAPIPEPAPWVLLLTGFGLLGFVANMRGLMAFRLAKVIARDRFR